MSTPELKGSLGFSQTSIGRLVDDNLLVRYRRGVYRGTAQKRTPLTVVRCELLRLGPSAAVARRSTGFHLGYLAYPPPVPQIVVPESSGYRLEDAVKRHASAGLSTSEVMVHAGLQCTTPERMVLDLAKEAFDEPSKRVLRRALRGAARDDDALAGRLRALVDLGGFPGAVPLRAALQGGLEETLVIRSSLEDQFLELCKRYGIPTPLTNVEVEGHELDNWWPKQRAFVEVSPYATHGDELTYEADSARFAALAAVGIRGFYVTDRRMNYEPAFVAEDVRGLLGLG